MKNLKKIVALLLAAVMILCMVACTAKIESSTSGTPETEDPANSEMPTEEALSTLQNDAVVTLTTYGSLGIDYVPWFKTFCQEKFGINWESKMADEGVMDALLTSGELTDMIFLTDLADFQAAANGGMLLNFDDYKDLLPHVYNQEAYASALTKIRSEANDGNLYGLPVNVGPQLGLVCDPMLRWDVYEKIGSPEIADYDALLDVLKAMMEQEPTTENGAPIYGIGLWNDWDKNAGHMRNAVHLYSVPHGYSDTAASGLTEQLADGSMEPRSILADDSMYKQALKWLFKANQMGVLDPDSITQNYEGFGAKANAGQYLSINWNWWSYGDANADDYKGFASVWTLDSKIPTNPDSPIGSKGLYLGISSKCKDIEKALSYIDWYYSYEGLVTVYNGPEGICWNWEDGKRVFTDEFINDYQNGTDIPGGGLYTFYSFCSYPGVTSGFPDENGDGYIDAKMNPGIFGNNTTKLQQSWQNTYGEYANMEEAQKATGGKNLTTFSAIFSLIQPAGDEINELQQRIGDILVEASWKMVYATDEVEFEAIWAQAQEDANLLGIDTVVEDAVARWNQAKQLAESYGIHE